MVLRAGNGFAETADSGKYGAPFHPFVSFLSVLGGLLGLVPAAHRLVDRVPMT